jgi:NAD(P)H dehydrogenase (quinone)
MVSICVVFHSATGHTAAQAHAVAKGAESAGASVKLVPVEQANEFRDDLNGADGIIFGSPTFFGSLSGQFKIFLDSTSDVWLKQGWKDKIAAGFTNSSCHSGDKLNSLVQLVIFAAQHGMVWIGSDTPSGNNHSGGSVNSLNRLGSWLGAMAQSNFDQGAELAPPLSDLRTAELLGERVARAAARWGSQ